MKKRHIVLILGLLAVMMISNLEDYLSSPAFNISDPEHDSIDYYLSDFSLSAMNNTGQVSHTVGGQYLAFWENQNVSFIIRPRLASKDEGKEMEQSMDAVVLSADEATLDHTTEIAELHGTVKLHIGHEDTTQFSLNTAQLEYNMKEKHISTDQPVEMVSPAFRLSGTGLDSELDQSILRLNANVKSTYQPH